MGEELIIQATELMREQTTAYQRLDQACAQLTAALTQSNPDVVTSLTRAGEQELLTMRSRLLRLMSTLTAFADARAATPGSENPINAAVREAFGQASGNLQSAAQKFQQTCGRGTMLATNGASYASACIEMFGILPTTYRAPYTRRGDGKTWA